MVSSLFPEAIQILGKFHLIENIYQKDKIDYSKYEHNGWFVGSGAVESSSSIKMKTSRYEMEQIQY